MSSLPSQSGNKKNSPNTFRIRTFLFRSYSFGIETINTSIHVRSRSSLENHTRFQTKMGKVFSDQKGPKPLPFPYIREYPLILTPFMIIRLYPVRSAQSAFYNQSVFYTQSIFSSPYFSVCVSYLVRILQRSSTRALRAP